MPDGRDTPKTVRQQTRRGSLPAGQQRVLVESARLPAEATIRSFDTGLNGLTPEAVRSRRSRFGDNAVDHGKPAPAIVQFLATFANPFILILLFLAVVMVFTDVVLADPADGPDYTGVVTLSIMVLVSVTLRFWQEYRSTRAAEKLRALVRTTTAVTRISHGTPVTGEIPVEDVVRGDIVHLAAGDMVPADLRIVRAKDLQVNQSMLTGESLPAEKSADPVDGVTEANLLDAPNLGFMGTSVISGSGTGVVIGTGRSTSFGSLSSAVVGARPETAFDTGIRRVTVTLIRFMLVMVPTVFVINGLTKDWTSAFLFGVTTAVGLTPEMLPLIVTANLAKGAQFMAKRKVIVKRLNSIQNLGAIDILATDKTGTLTEDRIVLEQHLNTAGRTSETTLGYAAANSLFQTGLRNLLDDAVVAAAGPDELDRIRREWTFVDEVPFDFDRRRMSVVVDRGDAHVLIAKGATEEMLAACVSERVSGMDVELSPGRLAEIDQLVAERNEQGLRVLAVAVREFDGGDRGEYSRDDEAELTLLGFLAFLDPPKASAGAAIASLRKHGTEVKVITGDNLLVAAAVCAKVGIDPRTIVLGPETDELTIEELGQLAEETSVFAKVAPAQKARIVEAMRAHGHTVGYLGDGINDTAAMRAADVGISVDTAVDIAKESADIILLEKDLTVLEGGVIEGRRTFVNAMKYIKMTASSNFGNMFSVLVASALLPFIPMIPVVVLVQNLTYDLSMLTLPWDNVDKDELKKPRAWESKSLSAFMIRIGPISSIFDITTYALMWFVFQANSPAHAALFQSGWFIESIISQTLIVHMLRTKHLPFVRSRASLPVALATGAVCVFGLVLPFSGWGHQLGLVSLPWMYFPWLIATLVAYCALTEVLKRVFIRRYGTWI
ncbi:magnesium-translocating P-type ATPase [Leifsonia xyli subsp. xyli]|uniref:Magnesium-transporting ATPase, P-type 1 n=2 Tax=Leifsonia xyli subsp. xyli TaxID=59736 RepID=Q6ACS8_LEIXX|nr:Mg++ transport, ATPase protein [Leifsonia xyli subsp. xyli str. CTCB07]ODA90169.1 magnesium-translocating P-type ATPase [Leifsonia xyli subsp. xyli]